MAVQEESVTLRLSAQLPGVVPLWKVGRCFDLLEEVISGAIALEAVARVHGAEASQQDFWDARAAARGWTEPKVIRLRMGSPLVVDLLFSGAAATAAPFVKWCIIHSEETGAAIPKFVKGWKKGWVAVQRLDQDAEDLQTLTEGVEVKEIEP
ncbi:hypothetical protein [Streptomyces sp. NPDC001450]